MSKKKDPPRYVLKSECSAMMSHGDAQFKEIKDALVGEKFGEVGGVVKELSDIKAELKTKASKDDVLKIQTKHKLSPRDKAVVAAAFITSIASIITAVIAAIH